MQALQHQLLQFQEQAMAQNDARDRRLQESAAQHLEQISERFTQSIAGVQTQLADQASVTQELQAGFTSALQQIQRTQADDSAANDFRYEEITLANTENLQQMQEGEDYSRADELLLSKNECSEHKAAREGEEQLGPAGWQRYLVTFFLFSGLANVYALRANLSVA